MERQAEPDARPDSGKLVAQVQMVPENELDEPDDRQETPPEPDREVQAETVAQSWPVKAIPLGLLALAVIVVSMILVLQGVFEMIPD